jgi:hypothetical protein
MKRDEKTGWDGRVQGCPVKGQPAEATCKVGKKRDKGVYTEWGLDDSQGKEVCVWCVQQNPLPFGHLCSWGKGRCGRGSRADACGGEAGSGF